MLATAASRPCPRSAEPWILVATILGSSLSFIDGTVVNVALPAIQKDLHASAADVQWVVEAYSLFLSALILVGGSLGDLYGRRRIFAYGIMLFTMASVWCGLAPDTAQLVIARGLQGVGGALLVPGSLAIIGASFGDDRRGAAIGTWSAFTTVTSALGPVLGGWLVQQASWRFVFFINVPVAALALILTFSRIPESRDEQATGGLDWLGAGAVTVGLAALVYGLIESGTLGLANPRVVGTLGVGIAALLLFVALEARGQSPMMPLSLFRSRAFVGANLLTLLLYGGLGGALYFLPFTLQQVQGYSATAAGASFLPFTVIVFALSRWAGGLVHRRGAKLPLMIGPVIAATGFVLFAVPDIGGSYWTTYFPAIVALGVGMAIVIAPLTTTVMGALTPERAGIASGVNNAVSRAAGLLAIAVLGLVVTTAFTRQLDTHMAAMHVTPALRQAIDAQQSRLAGIQVPAGTEPTLRASIIHAVDVSFLFGFRIAMLAAAGLALLSALAAAFLIEGKQSNVQRT